MRRHLRPIFLVLALFAYLQATVGGDFLHSLYHSYSAYAVQGHDHAPGTFKASAAPVQLTDWNHDSENGCGFFGILHSAKAAHVVLQSVASVLAVLEPVENRNPASDVETEFKLNPQDSPRAPPAG